MLIDAIFGMGVAPFHLFNPVYFDREGVMQGNFMYYF